jgi:RNA polymerase sigma factor (sigma-70 family)
MDDLIDAMALDLDMAFPRVVERYGSLLLGLALRVCGDPRDAEEVVQDTFVRAHRALRGYDAERLRALHLRAWLATIALNLARNRHRRRAIDHVSEPLGPGLGDRPGPDDTARDVQRRDDLARWGRLIDALPLHLRVPLVLRHIEGLAYGEVAEVLGRPIGTVKAQVHRAARQLRAGWEDEEGRVMAPGVATTAAARRAAATAASGTAR